MTALVFDDRTLDVSGVKPGGSQGQDQAGSHELLNK
jgi:hypothetical protein